MDAPSLSKHGDSTVLNCKSNFTDFTSWGLNISLFSSHLISSDLFASIKVHFLSFFLFFEKKSEQPPCIPLTKNRPTFLVQFIYNNNKVLHSSEEFPKAFFCVLSDFGWTVSRLPQHAPSALSGNVPKIINHRSLEGTPDMDTRIMCE